MARKIVARDTGYPQQGLDALADLMVKLRGQYSLREFSEMTGVPHNVLRLIELGQTKNPEFRTLEKIAEYADISIESIYALLTQSDSKNRKNPAPSAQQVIFWALTLSYFEKIELLKALAISIHDNYPKELIA